MHRLPPFIKLITRIALCYSGQPRDFIHAVDNHREHFGLGQSNVDVFGHIWFDDSVAGKVFTIPSKGVWPSAEIKNWITDNWKPKKIVYESPRRFDEEIPNWRDFGHPKDNQISQFYSMEQVMKFKRDHEEKHNFKYDYVVRMRTDTVFLKPFGKIEDYDKDKLHVFKVNPGPDWTAVGAEKYAILDITAWGGSEVMDKYASTYSNLQQIVDEGCPTFSPDLPLGWNAVNVNGLDVEKHDWHFRLVVSTSGIYGTP